MKTKTNDFPIEMLETIKDKLEKYFNEYNKYSKPFNELWSFKLNINDTSITGKDELQKIYMEIIRALEILRR